MRRVTTKPAPEEAMSAVSAESPRGSADLTKSSANPTEATAEAPLNGPAGRADFGPNQWLVDELYQRYQADPGSVDQAWWSFFADYQAQSAASAQPAAQAAAPAGTATADETASGAVTAVPARNGVVAPPADRTGANGALT